MSSFRTIRPLLRPMCVDDAAAFARLLRSDPEGVRMTGSIPEHCTEQQAVQWIAKRTASAADRMFAIIADGNGEFMGGVGFSGPVDGAVLGYWIGRPFRGQGLATEAVRLALEHARAVRVRRLTADTFPHNLTSARILCKHGFRLTGTAMRNLPLRGGLRLLHLYELLLDPRD